VLDILEFVKSEPKLGTQRDCEGGEQTTLKKQRVSLKCVHVWGVNSILTKHSDCFVYENNSFGREFSNKRKSLKKP